MFSRKKMYALIAVMLVAGILMLYAHTYVDVHYLNRVYPDQAVAQRGGPGGSYKFVKGESEWALTYTVERPSDKSHDGYVWAYFYKIGENRSYSSPKTGIRISSIDLAPTKDLILDFDPAKNVIYDGNCTYIRLDLFFSDSRSYNLNVNVNIAFYQHPVVGIISTGTVTVPINATITVNPFS